MSKPEYDTKRVVAMGTLTRNIPDDDVVIPEGATVCIVRSAYITDHAGESSNVYAGVAMTAVSPCGVMNCWRLHFPYDAVRISGTRTLGDLVRNRVIDEWFAETCEEEFEMGSIS